MLSARLNRKVARLNYSHGGAGCKVNKVYLHHRTIVHGHKLGHKRLQSSQAHVQVASWSCSWAWQPLRPEKPCLEAVLLCRSLSLQHLHLAANIRVESCLGRVSCRLGVGESVWAKFAICGLIWGPVSSLQVSVWLSHRTIHHLHNDHQTISNPPQKLSVCQFCQSSASMMWVFL